jgi:hypothetical protein
VVLDVKKRDVDV